MYGSSSDFHHAPRDQSGKRTITLSSSTHTRFHRKERCMLVSNKDSSTPISTRLSACHQPYFSLFLPSSIFFPCHNGLFAHCIAPLTPLTPIYRRKRTLAIGKLPSGDRLSPPSPQNGQAARGRNWEHAWQPDAFSHGAPQCTWPNPLDCPS
ncbi:hypothetical protein COCSADRAFT_205299 [Bipolaris sorokiniana ND90Pr]|uniref:Uncharacterized protein n=1 Tax=Cochliobolus sativus (strain ND90Pr / ATCC 201652) TaxID=665912 RepID=M2SP84_COCSN|nr:uncharacterized protein COCSADRAFT_205299 [Bipolaris sorokiniana ND90Pr]EMD69018.1 hypothetical protein COCSADRAFT_205299 [Bipolaris sorokiniana ND90Pr]